MKKILLGALLILVIALVSFLRQTAKTIQTPSPSPSVATSSGVLGASGGCHVVGGLPDKFCTPGNIIPGVTKDQICVRGYAKSVRDVPESEKNQVFKEYGVVSRELGEYEVDHLISLELGGANDITNLWPESAEPRPGFHEKDKVENYLHQKVCNGEISLEEAQKEISTNWLEIYNSMQ